MKIDSNKIIAETISAFKNSGADKLYASCTDMVNETDYKKLHPSPLTPLDIKIDPKQFNKEIVQYDLAFEQWGSDHTHLPRFGAALVNRDGTLSKNDPINGSLMAWNKSHSSEPLLETNCCIPTAIMSMPSLKPLNILDGYWCRSNILKWHEGAMFVPHIDTIVPSMWLRLWASMSPNLVVRFARDGELAPVEFEVGRVYIVDTSLVHDAYATSNDVHQLFLSVMSNTNILLEELCQQ
jgi:hypothetical protein